MYVQLAWGRARPGTWDNLRQFYVDKVIPFTMGMSGLQERQLWRGTSDPDEMGFYSVWGSLQDLRNYETSEARRQLAGEAEEFFYPMAYPRGETWIKHFEVVSSSGSGNSDEAYVMMAWGKLRLGSWDQFEDFYRAQVEKTTGTVDGLRNRALLRSTEDPDEGLSISVWDSEDALLRYERSGLRRDMAQEVENLYRGEFWVKHFQVTDSNH